MISEIRLDSSNSGDTFNISKLGTVIVELNENPTTGYRWELRCSDTNIVVNISADFVPKSASMIGGGGKRIFRFLARDIGTVTLDFIRKRAWEPEESSVDKCTVTIHVLET